MFGNPAKRGIINVLEALIDALLDLRQNEEALHRANQLRSHDPLHESAYRRLMHIHALLGDRAAALRVYHACASMLRKELGVEPAPATQQLHAHLLQHEVSTTQPSDASQPVQRLRLVGRHAEWQQLQQAWRAAQGGRAQAVVLWGEAGIGATRLAEELLDWAGRLGHVWASSRAYAVSGGLNYAPIADWLRTPRLRYAIDALDDLWRVELARLLPELLSARPDLPRPEPLTEMWQQQRFFQSIAQALQAAPGPLLLHLDNMQWSDGETLHLLQFLLHSRRGHPLLVLGTLRTEDVVNHEPLAAMLKALRHNRQLTELRVGPLSCEETRELVEQIVGAAITPELAAALYASSEGNPLYLVETLQGRLDGTAAPLADQAMAQSRGATRIPPNIYTLIAARLGQLSLTTQQVASTAAVIGRNFTYAVLQAATAVDELPLVDALDELWQRCIIREQEGDSYDFSHDRIREVAYQQISRARRRLLQRRVAAALEIVHGADLDAVAGELAAHYAQAGDEPKALRHETPLPNPGNAEETLHHLFYTHPELRCLIHVTISGRMTDVAQLSVHLAHIARAGVVQAFYAFANFKGKKRTMKPRSAYRLAFRNSLLLVIGVLLFALSTTRVAQAADFTVTTTDDTADGVCDDDCSLREAIIAANDSPGVDIITVPAGTYKLTLDSTSSCNQAENGRLKITGPVTLNGVGSDVTIVDGSGLPSCGGVFDIAGQAGARISVTLAGLTVRNSVSVWSGVAATEAAVTLSHSAVVDNTAYNGGGIFLNSGTLMLQSSTVARNTASVYGGGISADDADVTVADSAVVSNTVSYFGGGIYFSKQTGTLTVLTSTIGYNTVSGAGQGGGIYASSGPLVLQGSTIIGNTAGKGGGIYADVNGHATITGTLVSHNTAANGYGGMGGGGLALVTRAALDIAGSTFEYNAVTDGRNGGGLYLESYPGDGGPAAAAVTIRDSSFAHNGAGSGGGLSIENSGVAITLTRTTFTGNQAILENNPPSGGGIYAYGWGKGSLALVDSTISDNVAHRHTVTTDGCGGPSGGGIMAFGVPLVVMSTTFSNNRVIIDVPACSRSSGGGAVVWSAPYTITGSVFVGNSAETGGGLYALGDGSLQNSLRNTAFLSNTAANGDGGGIYSGNDSITAVSVTLQGNTAAGNGGGAYGTLTLDGSLIKDNIATGDGGGLAGGGTLLRSTVTGNRAANGGGLALLEADVAQSLIAGNSATEKGGGVSVLYAYRDGPTVKIHNSTISGNQAGQSAGISHGGPVYKLCQGPNTTFQYGYGGKMLLDNTTIAANVAVTGTGGIRVNIEDRDLDAVEQAECPNGFVNWGTGSDVIETEMVNVLVAENTGDNCTDVAADASQGHNLSDDATCLFTAAGDQTKLDAKLGPLQNNGGPTWTHALLAGSPAIDSASNASCPAIDQRGVVRPQGVACDIGAYEFTATTAFLAVTPQAFTFAAVAGANPPPAQGLQIANTGVGVLNWTASEAVSWLSLDKTSGTGPATVNLTVDATSLTPGSYYGAITISASSANGSPQTVSIALQVVSAANLLKNGNFEAGRTGWTETASKGQALIRQGGDVPFTTPRSGSWAAVLGQVNGETSDLRQAVLLPGGDDLALVYYTFGQSAESRCDLEIAEVRIDGSKVASHPLCQANNSSGWTKQTVDLNPYRGQNVTLHFYLKNDGISDPSTLLVDDVQLQFGVESATGAVTPANGGAVTSGDGKVNITFPQGAVNGPIDVAVMTQGAPSQPAGGYRFAGKSFVVEATDSSGRPVTQFNQPFTLRVDYADSDWQNAGITEESELNLYFWNGAQWTPVLPCAGCAHDLTANRIVAVLDHLTEFAMLAEGGATSLYLPVVTR